MRRPVSLRYAIPLGFLAVVVLLLVVKVLGGSGLERKVYATPILGVGICPGAACGVDEWQSALDEWHTHGAPRRVARPVPSCTRWPSPGTAQVRPWQASPPPEAGVAATVWSSRGGWTVADPEGSAVHWVQVCAPSLVRHEAGHLDWPDVDVGCSPMHRQRPGDCWGDIEATYRRGP